MKHFYALTALIILVPFLSKAQSNYKPGYVVSANGDTIKGYIDYREWQRNPKQFLFKKYPGDASFTNYGTINADAFGVSGFEYYQKFVVSVSQDKVEANSLSTVLDTSSITDTVFLKVLVKGHKLVLYSLYDGVKERFYVAEDGAKPFELIRHLYLNPDDQSKVISQTIYKRQLQRLAFQYQPGNDKLKEEINDAKYGANDILPIVKEINGAGNYTQQQNESISTSGSRFFAGVEIISTSTKFSGDIEFAGLSHTSLFPEINAGMDFLGNKNIGTLFFRLELGFTGNKVDFNKTAIQGAADLPFNSTLSFNQYIGYLNPQVVYNFYNTKQLKVYVALGAVLNYALYSDKNYSSTYTFGGSTTTINDIGFPDLNAAVFNGSGKVGLVLNNNLDINIGYEPPMAINDNIVYTVKIAQYSLGIKYLFGLK